MADDAETTKQFSCYQCRAKKLKCNRTWPCERCLGLGEDCHFPESRRRPGQVARRPRVKELQDRLSKLQVKHRCTSSGLNSRVIQAHLEHRFKIQAEAEQHAAGHTPGAQNNYSQVIPTGRLEQLPPQSVVDELTNIYFSRLHSDAPMLNQTSYLSSLYRPPHMQPPICLQYAILALAANHCPAYKELALAFYHRARNYMEHDEIRADSHQTMTLGHAQCWILLSHFEGGKSWFTRASLSVSRSVRLAQMLGLYDVEAANGNSALAPTDKWLEKEERRRTMWAIFCTDRLTSSTTGWHPLVDVSKVRTLLPASEEAFQLGVEETSLTLHEALGNSTARLSPFACRVLAAHLFHACLEHSFSEYPADDVAAAGLQQSEFWNRQQYLDNRLAALFVALPDCLRCPENLARHDAVLINLTLHTASICIYRVGLVRAKGALAHAVQRQVTAVRLITAAQAIFAIINGAGDDSVALFSNPFAAFAAYMAALSFLDDFATTHNHHSEECLSALMDAMVAMANESIMTASLALQLAGDLKRSGIDPSALDKVKHLAARVEADGITTAFSNQNTGTVLFCPFHPKQQDDA